jgi:ElaB/YqjD/DUF883 family membrane-anchored ribosome-binding protein
MDTVSTPGNFAKQAQDLADKAADKVQSGINNAKDRGSQAADRLSDRVESARGSVGRTADQAETMFTQTIDSLTAAGKKVRSTVSDVGDSVVTYTKDNPVKAILISVAAGALIARIARAFNRD